MHFIRKWLYLLIVNLVETLALYVRGVNDVDICWVCASLYFQKEGLHVAEYSYVRNQKKKVEYYKRHT